MTMVIKRYKAKEAIEIERAVAHTRRCSNIFLRLLLFFCFLALGVFLWHAYPLLGTENQQQMQTTTHRRSLHRNAGVDYIDQDWRRDEVHELGRGLNQSFIAYASADGAEPAEKQRIKMLMDDNQPEFQRGRYRNNINNNNHNNWRYQRRMDHYVDISRTRQPRARGGPRFESWLLQLQSPRYDLYWPRFRTLLGAWARRKHHDPTAMMELVGAIKTPVDNFFSTTAAAGAGAAANQQQQLKPLSSPLQPKHAVASADNGTGSGRSSGSGNVSGSGGGSGSGTSSGNSGGRYKTCAVVGNSGILLNRSFGSFIDGHDAVIRLNNARVKHFEDSVGAKTTISFVNSNIYHTCSRRLNCFCHPYGDIPIVMYICQAQQLMDIAYCERHYAAGAPVLVVDPRIDVLCARLVKWYSVQNFVETTGKPYRHWAKQNSPVDFHYSSGFQAVVLALGICETVDILGFGKDPDAKHHYHTNQKAELSLHDYAAEYRFYDDLAHNRSASIPFWNEAIAFGFKAPLVTVYR